MKKTSFLSFPTAGFLIFGGLAAQAPADSLAELEALAEKARQAAQNSPSPASEGSEPVAEPANLENSEEKKPADEPQEVLIEEKGAPQQEAQQEVVEVVEVDLVKRAESLGLLSQLSAKTTGVVTFTNGAKLWDEVQESQLGGVLLDLFEENEVDLDDPDSPAAKIAPFFAEEFVIALGEGVPEQTKNLLGLSQWSDKFQIVMMLGLLTSGLEEDAMLEDFMGPSGSFLKGFREDPDFLLNFAIAVEMPPVLLAARISDDESREEYRAALAMGVGMGLNFAQESFPFLSESTFEAGGMTFSGVEVDGEGLIDSFEEDAGLRESLEAVMDPAAAQDFLNTLKEKDVVLAAGISDEAVYLYLGPREADIPLVKEGEASLVSGEDFAFTDAYLDETLVNVSWFSEEFFQATRKDQPILGSYIEGLRMGIADSEAFGDTKKLTQLLAKAEEMEKAFLGLDQFTAGGSLSYLGGDGLYTESFGGVIEGVYDWETPFILGSDSGKAFLTAQWVGSEEGNQIATDYLEAVTSALYELATLVSKFPELEGDLADYKDGFLLFDEKMKLDVLSLYKGLGITSEGTGLETIMEIDLQGTWPTVPNIPAAIIEKGLAPRISMVSSVTDSEKLSQSWKEIEKSVAGLLKTAGDLAGEEIPMQKPMSSQANDLTTWFFPIPMQTDDFVPSITLDEEVLVMSTSKKRAIALANIAKQQALEPITGVSLVVNFEPMQGFLASWLKLAEENSEELLTDEDFAEFLTEYGEYLHQAITALEEFESWSTHVWMEEGVLRSSSHFKTK